MRTRVVIEELSERDLRELVRYEVSHALGVIQDAIDEVRLSRPVISHRAVALECDVRPETVLDWIHRYELPASKMGRVYYIHRDDLHAWQMRNREIKRAA